VWSNDIHIIREDQNIYFEIICSEANGEAPFLFIEDYTLNLIKENKENIGNVFRSITGRVFREAFGFSIARVQLGEEYFELKFEVLLKKVNAKQVEEMIRYLTQKHDDIIRICLSRTTLPMGAKEEGITDPETILNTVESFVNTLISHRLELQHHLRKRLIPVRQPAWKSSQGSSNIDPFDIISNLDTLQPTFGEGDVIVNGRCFSIGEIEVTTLEPTANVEENAILLGGLRSMRRVIIALLNDIDENFSNSQIPLCDLEYQSLKEILLRLTSSSMKRRGEQQLNRLEEFIRYFERVIGVIYQGERRPIMTPFVRSSRIYRRLFEQLHEWYALGKPSLIGTNFLVKLRSASKIYEIVTLYKLIDYLNIKNWSIVNIQWLPNLDNCIPSMIVLGKNDIRLTLHYETKIHPYNKETKHLDLVDMKHLDQKEYNYKYRCPDFIMRLDNATDSIYIILDAKYSSANTVKTYSLSNLLDKYFIKMAVYDAHNQVLKQDRILGVIALFPAKNCLSPIYMPHWKQHGIGKKPIRLPIVLGLPILPESDDIAYDVFDQILVVAENHLHTN
jgi:hypothetical protein